MDRRSPRGVSFLVLDHVSTNWLLATGKTYNFTIWQALWINRENFTSKHLSVDVLLYSDAIPIVAYPFPVLRKNGQVSSSVSVLVSCNELFEENNLER